MKGNRSTTVRAGVAIVAIAVAQIIASPASAQVQTKSQQACLNKLVKTARKISSAVLKDANLCIRKGAAGTLPMGETAESCRVGDLKGKVAKQREKLEATDLKSCPTPPDFGYLGAPVQGQSYESENQLLTVDAFLANLDATLAASHGVDPKGRCSSALPNYWRKLEGSMHRTVESCLKNGLKSGTVASSAGFAACLDSVLADEKGRIARAVALIQTQLLSKCPGGSLATMYPGLVPICAVYGAGSDAAGIADCSQDRLECRLCRLFDFAYGLDRDCDLFDDTLVNGSCPDCGNTVVDSGEQCDDGNETSGDGCTSACVDEFCGDGTVNDGVSEVCDDGGANSDTAPDACRLDCSEPVCGDGVTDPAHGEQCDDANEIENDGCTSQCTRCGDGVPSGLEQCDDGNTAGGDCCSASCTFEVFGSPCTGAPGSACTAPGCNGAGSCAELPKANGTPCDDGDDCTSASACQAGACTLTTSVVTGSACRWAVVGNPTTGSGGDRRVQLQQTSFSTGDWCGDFVRLGDLTTMGGDAVAMEGDNTTNNPGAELDGSCNINAGDVVTNNSRVNGLAGENLPGLVPVATTVAAGQVRAKSPAPTEYDTTGLDSRVSECAAAQLSISTSAIASLNSIPSSQNLGAALTSMAASSTHNVNPVSAGFVNVIDVTNITGGNSVTLNFSGGGNANTVMVIRVSNAVNSAVGWHWNLTNGLTADHFLIYGKGTSQLGDCSIGQSNIGAGTIFCPSARVTLTAGTQWTGALFGGGTTAFAVDVGQSVTFMHQRFIGF